MPTNAELNEMSEVLGHGTNFYRIISTTQRENVVAMAIAAKQAAALQKLADRRS